jgi:hypothetical protein
MYSGISSYVNSGIRSVSVKRQNSDGEIVLHTPIYSLTTFRKRDSVMRVEDALMSFVD